MYSANKEDRTSFAESGKAEAEESDSGKIAVKGWDSFEKGEGFARGFSKEVNTESHRYL